MTPRQAYLLNKFCEEGELPDIDPDYFTEAWCKQCEEDWTMCHEHGVRRQGAILRPWELKRAI